MSRDPIIESMHPDKMSPEEFAQELIEHLPDFVANMNHLSTDGRYPNYSSNFMEDWMHMFSAWMECENTKPDEIV